MLVSTTFRLTCWPATSLSPLLRCRGSVRGRDAVNAHVRAIVVVSPEPLRGEVLGLLDSIDDVLVQPFVPDGAVVSLDVCVLLRLTLSFSLKIGQ